MSKLRELLSKATPGPWVFKKQAWFGYEVWSGKHTVFSDYIGSGEAPIEKDAELIVTMRNVLPELLDVVDAAARFIETDLIADHFNLVDTVAVLNAKLGETK